MIMHMMMTHKGENLIRSVKNATRFAVAVCRQAHRAASPRQRQLWFLHMAGGLVSPSKPEGVSRQQAARDGSRCLVQSSRSLTRIGASHAVLGWSLLPGSPWKVQFQAASSWAGSG